MNFTITSSWVRFALPLSIFMLLITSLVGQTTQQAALVKDIRTGTASSNPTNFTSVGNIAYFTADDGTGSALWKSDGTSAGTVKIGSIVGNPQGYNGKLYYTTKYITGSEFERAILWSYNGSISTIVDTIKETRGLLPRTILSTIGSNLVIDVLFTAGSTTYDLRFLSKGLINTTKQSRNDFVLSAGGGIYNYKNFSLGDTLAFFDQTAAILGGPQTGSLYSVKKGVIWTARVFPLYRVIFPLGTINDRLIFIAPPNTTPYPPTNFNLYSIGINGDSVLIASNFSVDNSPEFIDGNISTSFNNKIYFYDTNTRCSSIFKIINVFNARPLPFII